MLLTFTMKFYNLVATTVSHRLWTALSTMPVGVQGWSQVATITAVTTISAGIGAVTTRFIRPVDDFKPPSSIRKPLGAFIVPGLAEELLWRAALLPVPAAPTTLSDLFFRSASAPIGAAPNLVLYQTAAVVLILHVCSHPILSAPFSPRGGKQVFSDGRFLFLATIVLSGATLSYILSGGSVWAAALTHGLPVALWRDFFGGEAALRGNYDVMDKSP